MNNAVFFLACLWLRLYMIELKLIVNCLNVNIIGFLSLMLNCMELKLIIGQTE